MRGFVMSKKFTIVSFNEDCAVYLRGFVEPKDIAKYDSLVAIWNNYYETDLIHLKMEHCLLLDMFDGEHLVSKDADDLVEDEIDDLIDNWESYIDKGLIYLVESLDANVQGIKEMEIVEEEV